MKTKFSLTIIGLFSLGLLSCQPVTNTKSNSSSSSGNTSFTPNTSGSGSSSSSSSSSSSTTGSGGGGYNGDKLSINAPGFADAGQSFDYRTFDNIIVHGTDYPNRYPPPAGVFWSSEVHVPSNDQYAFFTNSRFNLRLFVRDTPNRSESDVRGNSCDGTIFGASDPSYLPGLRVKVCVRSKTSYCYAGNTFTFEDKADNGTPRATPSRQFSVPNTNEPLVVEVLDVQWDWACLNYYQNDPNPTSSGYCPYGPVSDTACVQFGFQFSTDETKDLPDLH